MEILDVGCTYSIGIAEIFLRQKEGYLQVLSLHLYPYIHQTLLSWFYGLQGVKSLLISSQGAHCLMKVAAHTSTTKIPQV